MSPEAPESSRRTPQLPPRYDAAAVQEAVARVWEEERAFHAEPTDPGEPFCIVIPPPNVTGALHLGHALNNTIQDILVRRARMQGRNAVWIPGTDHAGISTQAVVDKRLQAEGKPSLKDYKKLEAEGKNGREQFIAIVQAWKDEYEARILGQLRAMGCSCDFDRTAFTMDEQRARGVREAFFRLFKDGLIYRGKRLVNWDPATQTALSDDEVEDEEIDGHFYYLRYPLAQSPERERGVSGSGENRNPSLTVGAPSGAEYVVVATTRPETMLGDTAVAINPKDPRAAGLRGRFVRLPITDRRIPILEDDYVVMADPESDDAKAKYATGFLKVTPAHDPNDWEIGQRHGLPVINIFAPDASISKDHGWSDFPEGDEASRRGDRRSDEGVAASPRGAGADIDFLHTLLGKSREEARKLVVQWFKDHGLLEDVKPYRHTVGHSYRSHVPIEPYLSDQWYVAVKKPIPWLTGPENEGLVEGTDVPKNSLAGLALTSLAQSPERERGVPESGEKQMPRTQGSEPAYTDAAAYFITFSTYGAWLHGRAAGSVDDEHNAFGEPYLSGDETKERAEFERLRHAPVTLDEARRRAVQSAVLEVCLHRGWFAHVVHVRTNHVHMVVSAPDVAPERVMNDFKAYATRALRAAGLAGADAKLWTLHGSTRYVWEESSLPAVIQYVRDRQGAALEPRPAQSPERERGVSGSAAPARRPEPLPYGRGSESSLSFVPERYARTFRQWHENIRDWCISRQLWWGHRIPVWTQHGTAHSQLTPEGHEKGAPASTLVRTRDGVAYRHELGEIPPRAGHGFSSLTTYACAAHGIDMPPAASGQGLQRSPDEWSQDPDVLDTWFSSALWPMSTLGWPDESAISDPKSPLNVWNPTDVNCTAREIITLWVSRMVMFNRYMRGHPDEQATSRDLKGAGSAQPISPAAVEDDDQTPASPVALPHVRASSPGPVPFRTVFIHAMIQDGEGRKMSKSLGNGVDPLDIIATHGTDAMRFTLAQMTTLTQDVRVPVVRDEATGKNTSPKFDLGRNFCNKLWNAGRFVIGSIAAAVGGPAPARAAAGVNEQTWTVVDRWILSRLARTVESVNQALDEFRFDRYATACYDFFWRDFCDWYVEASKPAMKAGGEQAVQTPHILATCLDVSLRLMHPMIPFATERLWWALCEVMPERGIPGRIMGCANDRIIRAAWPKFDEKMDTLASSGAERIVERLQEIVQAIRTIRTDNKVEPRKTVPVVIRHAAAVGHHLTANKATVELWAGCQIVEMGESISEPEGAAKTTAAGCEIFVMDVADPAAEAGRLARQRAELQKKIRTLRGRLENKGYTDKAPPGLVQQTRDELAAAEGELTALG